MKITFEINPGKDIDATDLTQLLQWAQRCDTGVALLGEAIGSLQPSESVQLSPYEISSASVSSDLSISGQIMQQISSPVIAAAPETPAPATPEPATAVSVAKKRGRRSAAEIEADAKRYAEALKVEPPASVVQTIEIPAPNASFNPVTQDPASAFPEWAPGVAVPPGMGVETPNFTAVPQTATAHVQPQAPAMPVVPPGPPINGVGGELTVDEMRSACSQMNDVKQGMPYRVLKNFGFFTIEAVPADQRANLVEVMRTELSAVA